MPFRWALKDWFRFVWFLDCDGVRKEGGIGEGGKDERGRLMMDDSIDASTIGQKDLLLHQLPSLKLPGTFARTHRMASQAFLCLQQR
jgi:hypothetical protein